MSTTTLKASLIIVSLVLLLASQALAKVKSFSAVSESGNRYELNVMAASLETMRPLPVTITITDKSGEPVTGAQVNCSLTMPAMAMPKNLPPIKETETAGEYSSIFLLTMGGLWHVELTSLYTSGEKDYVAIPVPDVPAGDTDSNVDTELEKLFHDEKK